MGISHEIFDLLIQRGVEFFKTYKKERIEMSDNNTLHCSHEGHPHHSIIGFYSVKEIHFDEDAGIVSVEMNGNCLYTNDYNKMISNPDTNAGFSKKRKQGLKCSSGGCEQPREDFDDYCEIHRQSKNKAMKATAEEVRLRSPAQF